MHSQAVDELLSQYLAMPARVSWKGALGDSVRGTFVGGRLELAGVAVLVVVGLRARPLSGRTGG